MNATYWEYRKTVSGIGTKTAMQYGYTDKVWDQRPATGRASNRHVEGKPRTKEPAPPAGPRWAVHLGGAYMYVKASKREGGEKRGEKEKDRKCR